MSENNVNNTDNVNNKKSTYFKDSQKRYGEKCKKYTVKFTLNESETSQQIDSSRIANVFFGTKENPQLSNFANRPFIAKFGKMESAKFYNVEQYFQATKMLYIRNYIEYKFGKDNPEVKQLSADINNIIKQILATNSPYVAKEFGYTRIGNDLSVEIQNAISGYFSEHWDKYRA